MTAREKLAREICWAGHYPQNRPRGHTKASYWKSISEIARENYRKEADYFAFLFKRVSVDVLNELT